MAHVDGERFSLKEERGRLYSDVIQNLHSQLFQLILIVWLNVKVSNCLVQHNSNSVYSIHLPPNI